MREVVGKEVGSHDYLKVFAKPVVVDADGKDDDACASVVS